MRMGGFGNPAFHWLLHGTTYRRLVSCCLTWMFVRVSNTPAESELVDELGFGLDSSNTVVLAARISSRGRRFARISRQRNQVAREMDRVANHDANERAMGLTELW
jgi:hypothetical protein